jgi:hypothetical protein
MLKYNIAVHDCPTHLIMASMYSVQVLNMLHAGVCLIRPSSANILPWYCTRTISVTDWGPAAPCSPLLANPLYVPEFWLYWIAEFTSTIIFLVYTDILIYCVRVALHAVQVPGAHARCSQVSVPAGWTHALQMECISSMFGFKLLGY